MERNNKLYIKLSSACVFVILMMSSLLAGHHGYCVEKENIAADLNHALALTLKERDVHIITPDTINAYRQMQRNSNGNFLFAVADNRFCNNLQNNKIKNRAYLTFDIIDDNYNKSGIREDIISSDSMILENQCCGETIALRGYARLSSAAIFKLSDQRMSVFLFLMAVVWAVVSTLYIRRKQEESNNDVSYGSLVLSSADERFHTYNNVPIHFTPMQEQLMKMFLTSPTHTLSKEDICDALWPKKDDANDTLYTLIRRLKPIIEDNTNLIITSDRSKGYILKIK